MSKRSQTIRNDGGITVRVIEAINGFKTKYGYWPSALELEPLSISVLVTHCLTPLGLYRLQSKVELREASDSVLVALGKEGDSFDYGQESWQGEHQHDARQWLGLDDVASGTEAD